MTRGQLIAAAITAVLLTGLHPAGAGATVAEPLDLPPPPGASQPDGATVPPASVPADLVEQLEDLQQFPQTRPDARVGLIAIDSSGATLTERGAQRRLLPASAMKLMTAAAALRLFGPDHRFITRVYATAAPDAGGVIDGDLVIVGGGDPVLASTTYIRQVNMDRPTTRLARLAGRIERRGVTGVTGRVLGDPSVLADEPRAPGWQATYLQSLDATPSSGLTVDAGLRLFRQAGTLRAAGAKDPARRTARELTGMLERRGVRIDGSAATTDAAAADLVEIARISSPSLDTLLTHMLQFSDNHLADAVFRMLGAATGDPTWRGSERAVEATLHDLDVRWDALRLADGSGLSRRNRLTAGALAQLLRLMANDRLREPWLALQAVAGRSGTMAGRLLGTAGEGRVYAKTGTLRDVRALAATVPDRGGQDHHVVVLVNNLDDAASIAAARRLADVLSLSLAVAQDGCGGAIEVSEADGPIRDLPERRICRVKRAE